MDFTHDKEFHDIVNNKDTLKRSAEKLLNNIIDELTLGVIFDTHRKAKMKKIYPNDTVTMSIKDEIAPNSDIFGYNNAKMLLKCDCPICERSISASRFAAHLEKCMGLGTSRVRPTSRRIMNNETNKIRDQEFDSGCDNEDDDDWIMGERRKKKKQRNGKKKGRGAS